MKKGTVYLIGSGTGNDNLITLKGIEKLKKADVVIFDRLVSKSLMRFLKHDAQLIYAGKESGDHHIPQHEINDLIKNYALEGKTVARLKGGDPFLFGRGAEEAAYIQKFNIKCEIIPGVTSALAAPLYAGISVTHRNYSSSVHIIAGNESSKKEKEIDYNLYAKIKGTLVFLMPVKNLDCITLELIKNGMDKKTPAAIIYNAATSAQKQLFGNLEDIAHLAHQNKFISPSVLVIGKTILSVIDTINQQKGKLSGIKGIVTRSMHKNYELSKSLSEHGCFVYECPCIKIEEFKNNSVFEGFFDDIKNNKEKLNGTIVFTSSNGVQIFFNKIKQLSLDIRAFADFKFAVIGEKTCKTLKSFDINADFVPKDYTATNLALELNKKDKNKLVYIFRSKQGNQELEKILKKNNKHCKVAELYSVETDYRTLEFIDKDMINADFITFMSAKTVESFCELNKKNLQNYLNKPAFCLSPITGNKAKELGFKNIFYPEKYVYESLVELILKFYEKVK